MAYKNLREFIKRLEKTGELQRITVPVDPHLEITEITDRVSKGPLAAEQGAAVRGCERLGHAGADQCSGRAAAHGLGAGRR